MPATNAIDLDQLEGSISRSDVDTVDNNGPEPQPFEVGKLTSAAVVKDYAETAANIKKVSDELGLVAQRCEALLHELQDTSKVLNDAADNFSSRGKAMAEDLERSAQNTKSVREAAMAWIEKIGSTSP